MSETEIIALPNREEICSRLANMDAPEYEKQFLHPQLLTRFADKEMDPSKLMFALIIAMNAIGPKTKPREWNIMLHSVNRYVDVLVDCEVAREKVMAHRPRTV